MMVIVSMLAVLVPAEASMACCRAIAQGEGAIDSWMRMNVLSTEGT